MCLGLPYRCWSFQSKSTQNWSRTGADGNGFARRTAEVRSAAKRRTELLSWFMTGEIDIYIERFYLSTQNKRNTETLNFNLNQYITNMLRFFFSIFKMTCCRSSCRSFRIYNGLKFKKIQRWGFSCFHFLICSLDVIF